MTKQELEQAIKTKFHKKSWLSIATGRQISHQLINLWCNTDPDRVMKLVEQTSPVVYKLKQKELHQYVMEKCDTYGGFREMVRNVHFEPDDDVCIALYAALYLKVYNSESPLPDQKKLFATLEKAGIVSEAQIIEQFTVNK